LPIETVVIGGIAAPLIPGVMCVEIWVMMMNVEVARRGILIMRRIRNKLMMRQVVAMTITIRGAMIAMETTRFQVVFLRAVIMITMRTVVMMTEQTLALMKIETLMTSAIAPVSPSNECMGQADCFTGIVTEIVDGDTLDVNNVRVRLTLVNTPERGDSGYSEAKEFTESMCPVGSEALVDEDDGQKEGSFDRLIGLVYCGNEKLLLNEHLLNEGYAQVFGDFCGVSEFSEASWIQKFGCN
jgi:endonuclease YncB( thermonuclease family)